MATDAIFFSGEEGFSILVKKVNFTGEICLDWKENIQVLIDFPADYIIAMKRKLQLTLHTFGQELDQVSKILPILAF